jgi:hypothetical protein
VVVKENADGSDGCCGMRRVWRKQKKKTCRAEKERVGAAACAKIQEPKDFRVSFMSWAI